MLAYSSRGSSADSTLTSTLLTKPNSSHHAPRPQWPQAHPISSMAKQDATSLRASAAAAAEGASTQQSAAMTTSAIGEPGDRYVVPMRWLHWAMAGMIITGMLLVQAAQNTKDGEQKGYYMMLHKSFGLLTFFFLLSRGYYRLTTRMPPHLPGSGLEQTAATASHGLLYAFMAFMPVTGILMGYFGGKGLPFFGMTIPGKAQPVPDIAKTAFKTHKWAGQAFEYFLPIHIGAAFYHRFKGQHIFSRVNPLA